MPFAINDHVKPKPEWATEITFAAGKQPALPAGKVVAVAPFGKGQVIKVEGDTRFYESGCFDKVEQE